METTGAIVFCQREGGTSPMLEDLLFSPAALWLAEALKSEGVERFFVVCHADDRERAAACFPAGAEVVTDGTDNAAARLNAFLEARAGDVTVVTRPVLLTTCGEGCDSENSGCYCIDAVTLSTGLDEGLDFESVLHTRGIPFGRSMGVQPLRTGGGRWITEREARRHTATQLMENGVRIMDPDSVYIDPQVTVGAGTVLLPGTILRGKTSIGENCELGPNAMIRDCTIGNNVVVNASQLNESSVEDGSKIGPFAYIRPNCHVGRSVKVGDFVELKNSRIGDGTKISHLTYVGDSDVGGHVNFGCGTVTVNYDGTEKFRTTIGDHAFIGCNTNLVAPVKVGEGAYTAAGSTITDDVPADSLAIARAQQVVKKQWAAKRRTHHK